MHTIFKTISAKAKKRAFTVSELLIVVAIIGVLVAISIPIFQGQLDKARQAVALSDARNAYSYASVGFIDYLASDDPTTSNEQLKKNIATSMLPYLSQMGIIGPSKNINANNVGNIVQVIDSVMTTGKTADFISYSQNRPNRLAVYIYGNGFGNGIRDRVDGLLYETKDCRYVVRMVFTADTTTNADRYHESGVWIHDLKTSEIIPVSPNT